MPIFLTYIILFFITAACQSSGNTNRAYSDSIAHQYADSVRRSVKRDTIRPFVLEAYDELKYKDRVILAAAPGTKSVIFNSSGTRLYAMNLEGMSVYEFDRSTRKITREFKFTPTTRIRARTRGSSTRRRAIRRTSIRIRLVCCAK